MGFRETLLSLVERPGAALLDGWSDDGRWTIALPDPVDEFRAEPGEAARLEAFLDSAGSRRSRPAPRSSASPFVSGWVGFLSYELGASWEGAAPRPDSMPEPGALFFRHESGWAVDPAGRIHPLGDAGPLPCGRPIPAVPRAGSLSESLPGACYDAAHEAIREGIARGDFYQVNLANRFSAALAAPADPRALYRRIAGDDPPPYAMLLRAGDFDVISASPELFLRADFRIRSVEMRPIKGTAPRCAGDGARDAAAAASLAESAKDRAENVMIVDLCRNDLGRVCETGSVDVPRLCRIRSHRVHHLESTVRGRLRPGATPTALLRATFPPGSVTGAPRRAAVAAIRALEPCVRGVYTGAAGFFDDRGRLAFNVAIRTAVLAGPAIRYGAGGGITWESEAAREREEVGWKAAEFLGLVPEEAR